MNIKIIISLVCLLLPIYGVIKKKRIVFYYGYFIFGLMVVFDQLLLFNKTFEDIHLALASLWGIQVILSIPIKLNFDSTSKLAKSAGIKIMTCFSIINFFGAYIVTKYEFAPNEAMYGHILLAILPLLPIYFVLSGNLPNESEVE